MCGISGLVAQDVRRYSKEASAMATCLVHRGPDGTHTEKFETCILTQNALRIVDLSPTGKQPMFSSRSGACLTFNGELYGYQKLKASIKDYPFKSSGDTELILALYDLYGEKFVSKLPGMFALAIWDVKLNKLVCARDRLGEKPFYYAFGPKGEFVFASEIKALLKTKLFKPELDPGVLSYFLRFLHVPPTKTIYKNVFVLPPGHMLTFTKGKTHIKKYWEVPETKSDLSFSQATSTFKKLLAASVEKELVSDVPLGIFLSGGLDSSTLVGLASKFKKNVSTFSLNFEGSRSEIGYANAVAKKYHTKHYVLTPKKTDIADLFIKMQDIYDEPFADSSNIPTYLISKLARKYVTVALTGDGGDELLGGYSHYLPLSKMPTLSTSGALYFSTLSKLPLNFSSATQANIKAAHYKRKFGTMLTAHEFQRSYYFLNPDLTSLNLPPVHDYLVEKRQNLNAVLRQDAKVYLGGDILVKSDRASMANSLELRSPFLDQALVDFCFSLPESYKVSQTTDKLLLRSAFADTWPESLKTRGKLGFGSPVTSWLSLPSMQHLKTQYLKTKGAKIFDLLPYDEVQNYIIEDTYRVWILLTLSVWLDKHL